MNTKYGSDNVIQQDTYFTEPYMTLLCENKLNLIQKTALTANLTSILHIKTEQSIKMKLYTDIFRYFIKSVQLY